MALQMAASVHRSLRLCLFLSIFCACAHSETLTYSRDELLNIRALTADSFPQFTAGTESFVELFVGAAAALWGTRRRRRRGKRAGVLVKLRHRGLRTPLPSIHLANLRSLPNKMDELLLLSGTNRDFANSAVLCFTETWLNDTIPDNGLHLPGFLLQRADRDKELSGKTRGGGVCFYINQGWCTDVSLLHKYCSPVLESFFLNCKPFYSPREFSSFILVGVYIPPQANVTEAQQTLSDQLNYFELKHPDSLFIIMGDFNRASLNKELPKYRQHINCPTRDNNTLDHCYTAIKGAYRSIPRAALGHSDHCLVHLIPTYKQRIKTVKPTVKSVRKWTNEAKQELKACFDCTDWSVFEAANNNLDDLTDTVTSYITFCEDMCVPTKTFRTYSNNKPWFTGQAQAASPGQAGSI